MGGTITLSLQVRQAESHFRLRQPILLFALFRLLLTSTITVASLTRDSYSCVAFGGLSRQIHLNLRSPASFPNFPQLLTLDVPMPVSALQLQTISYNKREEITWNVRIFAGSQDKSIHMYSVSIVISPTDHTAKCSQFHHLTFIGHNACVRSLSFIYSASGEATHLLTGADDFVLKVWPLNLLETEKVVRCTSYEGHDDDILAVDCKSGWIITGSKDKSVGIWDLNPAKTVRAEKAREVKIVRIHVGSVVRSVVLSEDATMAFAGCGDGSVKTIVRADTSWSLTASHTLHSAPIDSLVFTQNVLVTSSQDSERTIAVWRIPSQ